MIENIRRLRRKRYFSQTKLAEEAKISLGMVGDIETGKRVPSLETLGRIADALNVQPYILLKDAEEDENNLSNMSTQEKIDLIIEILDSLRT